MVDIDSDSTPVATAIANLLDLLRKNGGRFDDRLVIRSRGGELSVHSGDGGASDEFIIELPPECLLPVEDFRLALSGDDILIADHNPKISPKRLQIMDAVLDVLNLTDKIAHYRFSHPSAIEFEVPELYARLHSGRPRPPDNALSPRGLVSDPLVNNLLRTRTLAYPLDPASDRPIPVVMAIIDYINHHPLALPYMKSVDATGRTALAIKESHPDHRTRECYVRYGMYDTYDTFLHHGFIDREAPFVISIPLQISLPKLGQLRIHAQTGPAPSKPPPKAIADLWFYLPDFSVDRSRKSADVGYLMIPQRNAPRALRRVLGVILQEIEPHLRPGELSAIVEEIEPQILSRNMAFYTDLRGYLQKVIAPTKFASIVEAARAMVDLQLTKLRQYPFFARQ